MHVNGCHIVSKLCKDSEEGFSSMVSRVREVPALTPSGEPVIQRIERGPFSTTREAQIYAHAWNDFDNPPPMPAIELPKDDPKAIE